MFCCSFLFVLEAQSEPSLPCSCTYVCTVHLIDAPEIWQHKHYYMLKNDVVQDIWCTSFQSFFYPKKEKSRGVRNDEARYEEWRKAGYLAGSTPLPVERTKLRDFVQWLWFDRFLSFSTRLLSFVVVSLRVLRAMRNGSVVFWAPAS